LYLCQVKIKSILISLIKIELFSIQPFYFPFHKIGWLLQLFFSSLIA